MMIIGTPLETHRHEHRVGLTPFGVAQLVQLGHTVIIEQNAGLTAQFTDEDYVRAGAQIVFSSEEVYKRSDMVCCVGTLTTDEMDLLKPGLIICAFHHLAVMPRENVRRLMDLKTTLVGYEVIRNQLGDLPVLFPMSSLAGRMSIHLAAHYLQNSAGGRGILIGNVPGIPPATVLVLGAGTVGDAAARQAVASGAHVIVLDSRLDKLKLLSREFPGQVVTVVGGLTRLEHYTSIADVVIGAVLVPGGRTPYLVTEEMVKAMKTGSVIIDVAIDQGGCVETSRPTTLDNPTYQMHGVVHFCVPNMTANIARTGSRALANGALPYLLELAARPIDDLLWTETGLADGIYLYKGELVNEDVAGALGISSTPLGELLGEEAGS
jgi:alanine dehydrogenase